MSIFDRLFKKPNGTIDEVDELEHVKHDVEETLGVLQAKLAQDPCAADPTREECGPELRRAMRQRRMDPALALRLARERRGVDW